MTTLETPQYRRRAPQPPEIAPLMPRDGSSTRISTPILVHHQASTNDEKALRQVPVPPDGHPFTPHVNLEVGLCSTPRKPLKFSSAIEPFLSNAKPDLVSASVGDVNSTIRRLFSPRRRQLVSSGSRRGVLRKLLTDRTHAEEIDNRSPQTDAIADFSSSPRKMPSPHPPERKAAPRESHIHGRQRDDRLCASRLAICPAVPPHPVRIIPQTLIRFLQRVGVLTLHRPSNVINKSSIPASGAIDAVAAEMPVIFPVHSATQHV